VRCAPSGDASAIAFNPVNQKGYTPPNEGGTGGGAQRVEIHGPKPKKNEPKPDPGKQKDCSEKQYTVGVNLSVGGSPVGFGLFLGGGTSVGLTSNGALFFNFQASMSTGLGLIGAVGATGGVATSPTPTTSGLSVADLAQADIAVGAGDMYGVTFQGNAGDRTAGASTGNLPKISKLGVGIGAQVSAGIARSVTLATPAMFPTEGCN
jgi:hypothetical protein